MATDPHALTYLALGDSYTIGEGSDSADRWPVRLSLALRGGAVPLVSPRAQVTTGGPSDELAAALERASPPLGVDEFVSLLVGVNHQYRGGSAADYRGEFLGLVQRAIALAGDRTARVMV